MKTTDSGLKIITDFEGWFPKPYNDPVGHCTIGYGHLIHYGNCTPADFQKWGSISRDSGWALLRKDLGPVEHDVAALVKVPITQAQFNALVSFAYNVGTHALAGSTLLRRLNHKDYHAAEEQFGQWVYADHKVFPGLVRRRKAEADLFSHGFSQPPKPALAWRWTKPRVREYQALHNAFRKKWADGYGLLLVDGDLGPATKAAIKEDKKLLGYVPSAQTWSGVNRAFFRRLKHPTFGLNRAQIRRGIAARRRFRRAVTSLDTVRGCASFLLNSPNVSFWDGLSTGSDRHRLVELAAAGEAYCPHTNERVTVSLSLLQALVDMAQHGHILINALTGGTHSAGSRHYRGLAVDLDLSVGDTAEIERIARRHGGSRNFETDHIHLDF